jgi:hypothetical protein
MTTFTPDPEVTDQLATHIIHFGLLETAGTVISNSPTQFVVGGPGLGFIFEGSGFSGFDGLGWPTAGTIESLTATISASPVYVLGDMGFDVPFFRHLMEENDPVAFARALFVGDDQITGALGDDILFGFAGEDLINGAEGDDYLNGGAGQDTLLGGKGKDRFAFSNVADSTQAAPDRIAHLRNNDKIDLKGIDADKTDDGDQAFTIVGAYTDTPGELRVTYVAGLGVTFISGDVDGDGSSDLSIEIAGDYSDFSRILL